MSGTIPEYLDLKSLAAHASCSVRWLRIDWSTSLHPLPHFRIAGNSLVKREDFDAWIATYRVTCASNELEQIVESVVTEVTRPRHVA